MMNTDKHERKEARCVAERGAYTALIRTRNSESTLPTTLDCLRGQTCPPDHFVFVDDGSTDRTLLFIPENAILKQFEGSRFNYGAALNQGLEYIDTDFVLIISSHTKLRHAGAIQYAVSVLRENTDMAAAYFSDEPAGELRYETIHRANFDGFNGLWNAASLVRMRLLRERSFREDVFTAEDQEWAGWVFEHKDGQIARINGAGKISENPRKRLLKKRLNEYVAVACYAKRDLTGVSHLAKVAWRCVRPTGGLAARERIFHFALFFMLLGCRVRTPAYKSRYY